MKLNFPREFYIPKGSLKITSKNSPAVAYLKDGDGIKRPQALGFFGKANKPAFNYSFRSYEAAQKHVAQWLKDCDSIQENKAERKAKRAAFRHTLKVGDILRSSWGYDQTNIDYYQITKLIGEHMVEARMIGGESESTAWLQGKCVPMPDKFIGPPKRYRPTEGNAIKAREWGAWARPVGFQTIAGAKVYGTDHWTAYA